MTVTTYYATHRLGRYNAEADALIHLINDVTANNGDNRSWDAMRAQVNALADPDTQKHIVIEHEKHELVFEDQ